MSKKPRLKAALRRIPLADLRPRRGRAYSLRRRLYESLVRQIASDGLYAPLIVRPAEAHGKYEILDGHQRAKALDELGCRDARCEVWPISDDRARILAVTLNHVRGRPNAKLLARQIRRLVRQVGRAETGRVLALSPAAMAQYEAALHRPDKHQAGEQLDLRPVTFHLPSDQLSRLQKLLRRFDDGSGRRGDQLVAAIAAAADAAERQGE